jgi:hypothetical protein
MNSFLFSSPARKGGVVDFAVPILTFYEFIKANPLLLPLDRNPLSFFHPTDYPVREV